MRQIPGIHTGPATPGDAAAIAEIYNQGIAERIATFETEPRTPAQIKPAISSKPLLAVDLVTTGDVGRPRWFRR